MVSFNKYYTSYGLLILEGVWGWRRAKHPSWGRGQGEPTPELLPNTPDSWPRLSVIGIRLGLHTESHFLSTTGWAVSSQR